eukprot:354502-Chlamydomonas_euryale.AAC.2
MAREVCDDNARQGGLGCGQAQAAGAGRWHRGSLEASTLRAAGQEAAPPFPNDAAASQQPPTKCGTQGPRSCARRVRCARAPAAQGVHLNAPREREFALTARFAVTARFARSPFLTLSLSPPERCLHSATPCNARWPASAPPPAHTPTRTQRLTMQCTMALGTVTHSVSHTMRVYRFMSLPNCCSSMSYWSPNVSVPWMPDMTLSTALLTSRPSDPCF